MNIDYKFFCFSSIKMHSIIPFGFWSISRFRYFSFQWNNVHRNRNGNVELIITHFLLTLVTPSTCSFTWFFQSETVPKLQTAKPREEKRWKICQEKSLVCNKRHKYFPCGFLLFIYFIFLVTQWSSLLFQRQHRSTDSLRRIFLFSFLPKVSKMQLTRFLL